jgi:hypothetical protein
LGKQFQRKIFLEIDQLEKKKYCLWQPYVLESSPLKPFVQMNRNLVGSINGKSSARIAHFVLIR